ncbi:cyclic nucleotide-binding domain-containing protein [Marinobacter sp. SS21]|uniref:cyclic nucleotide-binding domain-containing protein n=1 Tax=Marinobacter sp. SS21 TaxID=2979460 RepID=UPI00232E2D55|nr:cyclic nucleotide-binding domain-containing protein [Marinobacter sp. SS21]MDC0661414.1 cyclic nucleotide-binding domain-containing protein [Marinobacter sp. SS21]
MRELDAREYWEAQGPAYFHELSTFGALPDEVVRRLLLDGRVIQLDAGELLYNVRERSDAFYIVLSGKMNTIMPRSDGGWAIARCHEPGEDMGFVPMIALRDRPARTSAEEASVVLEIRVDQFFQLHQDEPDAFGLMLLNLTRGMARAIISMATVMAEQEHQLHKAYLMELESRRQMAPPSSKPSHDT